ncbi:hypothetical protein F5148DRAFT_1159530 [Russula earlei]|uniref:Uncharacterized protein n=1 Tax=Russula earlei TaxID=71964 RepID=A0ACC0UMZ1_9AGAM|nr:hypothetical protein F5148DRAFT_1159530 [Russula earlei]
MSFFDKIRDKLIPDASNMPMSTSASGGIGNGRGALGFEDEMIVSKPAIICHTSQAFFGFLAMCCFASVASFQARFKIGPSGLSGFAIFISLAGMFLALFLLLVPLLNEKFDKLTRVARALKEDRTTFVLVGTGTALTFLIAFVSTISAWTEPGCKDAKSDPHAKALGDSFTNALPGWCATKKAGAIFFWLALIFWCASFTLTFLEWRRNRASRPRDGGSTYGGVPSYKEEDADNETRSPFSDAYRYSGASSTAAGNSAAFSSPGRYNIPSAPQPRPSLDAYGAFSDPAPSGFGAPSNDVTGVSRTMQYADPYAAVRASVARTSPPAYQ